MEPCVTPQPTPPPSPFVRQHSQGSDGAVVQRRSLCFTPRSVSLPMTPTAHYSQSLSFQSDSSKLSISHGYRTPHGIPVPTRSGSMTIPTAAASVPLRQFSYGTSVISRMTPKDALHSLQLGNSRFLQRVRRCPSVPPAAPFATIIACTDCPQAMEVIFDAQPGSLFVATTRGCYGRTDEGLLKKIELGTKLGSSLILVLGHKDCMTLLHAAQRFLAYGEVQFPTIQQATSDMGPCGDANFVCDRAMTLNVMDTMKFLLGESGQLREQVRNGKLQIHGGMFDPFSGGVHFMGPMPGQAEFLLPRELAEAEKASSEVKGEGPCDVQVFAESELPETVTAGQKEPVVEKAGDSEVSQPSQGTRGTPGSDCEQSEPTSSQEDEADLLEKSQAPEFLGSRGHEGEPGATEHKEHELPPETEDVKSLQPEESQISEESGDSGTTDAPSNSSHVSHSNSSNHSEHTSSIAPPSFVTELPAGEVLPETVTVEGDNDFNTVNEGQPDSEGVKAELDQPENAEGEAAGEKVILGPYFAAAFDLWMGVGSPGLQLLRQNLEQWVQRAA